MERGSLESQPFWAQALLRKKPEEPEVEDVRGVQSTGPVASRADLTRLVHQGDGGGLVVDDALAGAYPGCCRDVAGLVSEGAVRHVLRQAERQAFFRRPSAEMELRSQHPAVHRLRAAAFIAGGVSWLDLLGRYDRTGSGLGLADFVAAVRGRGRLTAQVLSNEDLRTVFGLFSPDLSGRAMARELVMLLEDDEQCPFPQGLVLFPRFEREAEAMRVDGDVRDAFHTVQPLHAGDSGAKVAPKQEAGPKQPTRRASNRKRKLQNTHMLSG